jgi:hypothetical protein
LRIDYLGGGNERGYNADYYVKLRRALDAHGYSQIKLIATDDHNPPDYWSVARVMQTNRAFADAVNILGEHDFCVWRTAQRHCYVSAEARSLKKPLWDSENSTQDYWTGCEPLARAMNRHYIEGRVTANFNWSLIGSYYGTFPAPGTGLLLADRPWSGWYSVGRSVWVDAHTTQFTQPGWRYLDTACGYTRGGASFVTLRSPQAADYSLVIETLDLNGPETLNVSVSGGLSANPVHVWRTNLRSEKDAEHFRQVATLKPANGNFQLKLEPGCLYTVSTTTGQQKGGAHPKASAETRLPLPFHEDFENPGAHRLAKYFSDVHGGFEIAPCGGGRKGNCYRQMVAQEPILWHGAKMPPTTIVGDPLWWGDYEVSTEALLEGLGYVELLGRIESQQHNVAGYHFQVSDSGQWKLYTEDSPDPSPYPQTGLLQIRTLAVGTNPAFGVNQWHRLALRFQGDRITALLDGQSLASVQDVAHSGGQAGLRVSAWQHAQFDNFSIVKTAPWPEFIPHAEMQAAATSEHGENDFGSVHVAANAIDDRVETSWRSEYAPPAPLPQALTLDLKHSRKVSALTYKPPVPVDWQRLITRYRVALSQDGRKFEPVATGTWGATLATKVATWQPRQARYVRFEALASAGDSAFGAAVGELGVSASPISSSNSPAPLENQARR